MYFSDVQVKNRQLRAEIVAGEQKRAKFRSVIRGTCQGVMFAKKGEKFHF